VRRIAQIVFFGLFVKPFLTLFIGLRVRGLENLPKTDPFLLVANHSSHLDTISLLGLFPMARLHRIQPVAAADYFERNRAISFVSRTLFNILPIARQKIRAGNNPIDTMCAALNEGRSLILFPEGTRGAGEIQSFRPGVAHLIESRPDVPVVPVYLVNMGRSLPKGQFIPVPFFCEVRIAPPLHLRGTRREIVTQLQEAVQSLKDLA
jgi:1-acyl-sn-glycerol-3-phosphate acyltransferase